MPDLVTYYIWRRQTADSCRTQWLKTSHTVKARTDKEAESRMKQKFASFRLHSMQLVAMRGDEDPNETARICNFCE